MLNLFNKPVYSAKRSELEGAIRELKANLSVLETELANRREDDSYGFGYTNPNGIIVSFPERSEAYDAATKDYGEEGAYRVTVVYKCK